MSVVYKYRKPNRDGWRILEEGALWLTSPGKFNDQNDMRQKLPQLFASCSDTIFRKLIQISRQQNASQTYIDILNTTSLAVVQGKICEDLRTGLLGASLIDQVRQEAGVICFGTTADNSHLWGKYAGQGKGFCLGFETHYLGKKALKVSYINEPKHDKLRYFESSLDEIREALCLIKDKVWKDEQEVRIIISRAAGQLLHFSHEALVSVTLGESIRKRDALKLRRLVKGKYPLAQLQEL